MTEPLPLRLRLPWCPKLTRRQRRVLVAQAVRRERKFLAMLTFDPFFVDLVVPF